MKEKPEALRLADDLEAFARFSGGGGMDVKAAAELRRLHAENERLREALRVCLAHWFKDDNPDELQENVAKFKELCGWENKP